MSIQINCDMGESFGIWSMGMDKEVMPYVDMANLACGFHAGDPVTMTHTVQLAKHYGVKIGAHPGYADLIGFGRKSIPCTPEEISALVLYQIGALNAICKTYHTKVSYVKPHGALYNDMMKDKNIFKTLVKTISQYNPKLKLMILSTQDNKEYQTIASHFGIKLIYEIFADRNYTDEGFLVDRNKNNALITDKKTLIKRIKKLYKKGVILSQSGKELNLKAHTICLHGDNTNALELIKELKSLLKK